MKNLLLFALTLLSGGGSLGTEHPEQELVILGINDLHGALQPSQELSSDGIPYRVGGGPILSGYFKIARKVYGDRLLILDAGDQFQGSLESNLKEGQPMVELLNLLGIDAATVGNHEFDFGPAGRDPQDPKRSELQGALVARMKEARYPYLSANIRLKGTKKSPPWPNFARSKLFQTGKFKIGVIGLTTPSTPATTQAKFVKNLDFVPLKEATLDESKKLRKQGADLIILLAHEGPECGPEPQSRLNENRVRKATDPQGTCETFPQDPLALLASLPQGTVDAAVVGHHHALTHHFIHGIPVIQSFKYGQYFHMIRFRMDLLSKKPVSNGVEIEGPFQVCEKVFANQRNCEGKDEPPSGGRGGLVSPIFLGWEVAPDPEAQKVVDRISKEVETVKGEVLGKAAREIPHYRDEESPMGALVVDAIRAATGTDFTVMNRGGIRHGLPMGDITYGDLYKVIPFDNFASKLMLTGAELKLLVRIAESGQRGVFPVSGLKVTMKDVKDKPISHDDLDGNGHKEHWEVNRVYEVTKSDGSPLQDKTFYTLSTVDFLADGGDDVGFALKRIPPKRIEKIAGPMIRDIVEKYIRDFKGPINTEENPLRDEKKRRFVVKP